MTKLDELAMKAAATPERKPFFINPKLLMRLILTIQAADLMDPRAHVDARDQTKRIFDTRRKAIDDVEFL